MNLDITTAEEEAVDEKFRTTYRASDPRWIEPQLLKDMTCREALILVTLESHELYDGSSGGGPVYQRAWEVLEDLVVRAEGLEK